MLEHLNDVLLRLADPVLGPLLGLPRDVALLLVAVGTALVLALVRVFTTRQELLKRCAADKKRLKARIKAVRSRPDEKTAHAHAAALRDELARAGRALDPADAERVERLLVRALKRRDLKALRATRNAVGLKTLRQEGLPLLVSLPLIVFVAAWAFARIGYYPPAAGRPVTVAMYLPKSAAGTLVHLEPQPGLAAPDGWVRTVRIETDAGQTYGLARWRLVGQASERPYPLRIKRGSERWEHRLLIGQDTCSPPLKAFDARGEHVLEVGLRPYKPFGVIGAIPGVPLAPWILGYLAIVIPFVPLLKRLLGLY
jgi:hypothetical protein